MAIVAGEVRKSSYIDLEEIIREVILDIGYKPGMSVKLGVNNFVEWYKEYNNLIRCKS